MLVERRLVGAHAEHAEVVRGYWMRHQRLAKERQHGCPSAAVAQRHIPESRRGKARHQNGRAARPHGRQDGIRTGVRMKRRHHHEVDIVGSEIFMRGTCARAPQRIAVRPEHPFGSRRRAGRVLHRTRTPGVCVQSRESIRIAVEARKAVLLRGQIRVRARRSIGQVFSHDQPADVFCVALNEAAQFRLRDRGDGAAVLGEVGEFFPGGARVGRHDDRAEPRAREPQQLKFRCIV